MFLLHGEAKYLDVFERVIYNGFLSGISLSGDRFFYPNPLACKGHYQRSAWFGCSCCPVNIVRFVPSIAGCVYATRGQSIYVNLYVGGSGKVKLGGTAVALEQQTCYPWDGKVRITVTPAAPGRFDLRLRIPGWAQGRPVPSDLYCYAGGAAEPFRKRGRPATWSSWSCPCRCDAFTPIRPSRTTPAAWRSSAVRSSFAPKGSTTAARRCGSCSSTTPS
jgi:hypothetical protein